MSRIVLSLFILVFFYSCNNNNEKSTQEESLVEVAQLSAQIDSLKAKLSGPLTNEEAKQLSMDLMNSCNSFVEAFPKDNRCADYLFISARAANGLRQYDASLTTLNRIKGGYRGYEKMPEVYFLYAFTLDEDLERKEDAQKAYMDLINKFPDDPLSSQAAILLDQLYLSDEELIEMWEMKEKNESNRK
jgi:hypothetical protein